MKTQEEILEIYKRKIRLFAQTGKDKFLDQMEVLKEILGIDDATEEKLILEASNEQKQR